MRDDYLGDGPFLTTCFPMPGNDVKGEARYCYTGGLPESQINNLFLGCPVIKLMHNFENESIFRIPENSCQNYPDRPIIPSLFDRLWGPLSCSNFSYREETSADADFFLGYGDPDSPYQFFPRLNQSQLDALGVKYTCPETQKHDKIEEWKIKKE